MSLSLNYQLESINTTSGTLSFSSMPGALILPQGNGSTQRPSSPLAGMLRFNTSVGLLEYYNGTIWSSSITNAGLVGPNTTTNQGIATWAGLAGGTLQNTGVTIDGGANINGVTSLTVGTINNTGSNLTIQTTTSGNISINTASGGSLTLQGNVWPTTSGGTYQVIATNGLGTLFWASVLYQQENLIDVPNPVQALTNLGGKKYKGTIFLNTNTALDASYFGKSVQVNSPSVITLPPLSSGTDGQSITFSCNFTNGSYNIIANGTDPIYWYPKFLNSSFVPITSGDVVEITCEKNNESPSGGLWFVTSSQSVSNPESVAVGNPTGGNLGNGILNAEGIYVNGASVNTYPVGAVAICGVNVNTAIGHAPTYGISYSHGVQSVSLSGGENNAGTMAVTLSPALPNTNYCPTVTFRWISGDTATGVAQGFPLYYITNKTTTSFDIVMAGIGGANGSTPSYFQTAWLSNSAMFNNTGGSTAVDIAIFM